MQRLIQILLFALISLAISNARSAPSGSDKRHKEDSKKDSQSYVKEDSKPEEKAEEKEDAREEHRRRPSSKTR